jgi:hypothetical protein
MTPLLSLTIACYILVRLVQISLEKMEHPVTRWLALFVVILAAYSIVVMVEQESSTLFCLPSSWRLVFDRAGIS